MPLAAMCSGKSGKQTEGTQSLRWHQPVPKNSPTMDCTWSANPNRKRPGLMCNLDPLTNGRAIGRIPLGSFLD